MFHIYYVVCFDAEKKSSLEDIREWFNVHLVGRGQQPWRKHGRKWKFVQSKLGLRVSMWQLREKPLPPSLP